MAHADLVFLDQILNIGIGGDGFMKLYISADMEGVAGIISWEQVDPGGVDYSRCRRLMAGEVNAAVSAALDSGATFVTVNDAHGSMCNLPADSFNPNVYLISGKNKKLGMMEGIDGGFSAACFIGYHARSGSRGVLAHTFSTIVHRLQVNGREMGELGLNAMLAGYFKVPVIMASGDQELAEEARRLSGHILTVVVKEAISYHAAKSLSGKNARQSIIRGLRAAIKRNRYVHIVPPKPVYLKIEFNEPGQAAAAAIFPMCRHVNAVTVSYSASDFFEAYQVLRCLITLAKAA